MTLIDNALNKTKWNPLHKQLITYVMHWAIWCHLRNLKNVKSTRGGVLLLVKFKPATLLKVTLLHGGIKSRNASYIITQYFVNMKELTETHLVLLILFYFILFYLNLSQLKTKEDWRNFLLWMSSCTKN